MPRKKKKQEEEEELSRAEANIQWCEDWLYIPEGKNVGHRLEMAQLMKDDFIAIYDNEAITRRAILSRGRKNAKTFEAACILLLHLCGIEAANRPNSQIFSTALSRDQAALVFNLAVKMVRMNPRLSRVIMVRETAKMLVCPKLGTTYRALSADAGTNFGLSPAVVIHDELGQVRGPRSALYEALETATAAQAEGLCRLVRVERGILRPSRGQSCFGVSVGAGHRFGISDRRVALCRGCIRVSRWMPSHFVISDGGAMLPIR